ncbi:MAG: HAD family phosphatase [Elusimicrobiota bacterium]
MNKPHPAVKNTAPDIRAVFFDIGNVLLKFDVGAVLRRFAWVVRSHPMKVARLLWSSRLFDGVERGDITSRQIHRIFCEDFEYSGSFDDFKKIWCYSFELNKDTVGVMRRVRRRRKVYLLSNTNKLHYEHIREHYAFARQVNGAVLSYRLRVRKPEPGIYHAALKRARVQASRALFIDDLKENVEAARSLGWHALHFRGAKSLEQDLCRLGVLPRARKQSTA